MSLRRSFPKSLTPVHGCLRMVYSAAEGFCKRRGRGSETEDWARADQQVVRMEVVAVKAGERVPRRLRKARKAPVRAREPRASMVQLRSRLAGWLRLRLRFQTMRAAVAPPARLSRATLR